jgi:actin-related protein 6
VFSALARSFPEHGNITIQMARQKPVATGLAAGELAPRTLILDNGAHSIKAGLSSHLDDQHQPDPETACHIVPNCIARSDRDKRTYVGAELAEDCDDYGDLKYRRPVEKGYLVNWESEKAIWERAFMSGGDGQKGAKLDCNPEDTNLILTEASNAPAALQRHADEMVFEEFGFASYYRTIGL